MKKQMILISGLVLSVICIYNVSATGNKSNEILAEASFLTGEVNVSTLKGRKCLDNNETICTLNVHVRFQQGPTLLANFDQLDASYHGETMEEFQFQVIQNNQVVTCVVPTQTLNWTGQGFLMNYQ